MLKSLRNEDWTATLIGGVLLLFVVLMPEYMKNPYVLFAIIAILSYLGYLFMGKKDNKGQFFLSFIVIYALVLLANWITDIAFVKKMGLESVFFSVLIGLIVRNTIGLPKWMEPAVRSEYYIKAGLVILGSSILFGEIMRAGSLGMIQAIIVVLSVWYFSFWVSRKMGVDSEMSMMLSSSVSICGVSAAIATCGAIKGDPKKLSFIVSLVLIVAIPMMYILPFIAKWIGLSEQVAGAWLGGTIDTTAAVVASGKFIGETAEQYSVIIKSAQNVLLGVAAFAISIYWSYRGTNTNIRPSGSVLWERFPKFVLGFLIVSLIFSFAFEPSVGKSLSKVAQQSRGLLFSLAFVCIGLETSFKDIFKKENSKYIWSFLIAQGFNIVLTLIVAWLLFRSF